MKTRIQSFTTWIKTNKKTSIAIVLLLLAIFFMFRSNGNKGVEHAAVVKGAVTEMVAVTGKTEANQSVELAFETSGRVTRAPLAVGSKVLAGQVLAGLDQAELFANLSKSKADLLAEQIKLDQIGKQSNDSYENARASMIAAIRDAYTRTDDAVRNNIDRYFYNKNEVTQSYIDFSFIDGSYQYTPVIDSGLRALINNSRATLALSLSRWQTSLLSLSEQSDITPFVTEAEKNLNDARKFLNYVADAVNSLPQADFDHQATVTGYKTDISVARTNVSTAIAAVVTAKDKLNAAPREVTSGTGSNFDDVLTQQARVAQFEAAVKSSEALLAKRTLFAPISGVVTKYDAKVGQIVTPGTPLISIITEDDLVIKASVSEVNIGKVNINDTVAITFDAYGTREFSGTVIAIEPAETIVDNVANYTITVVLSGEAKDLKSGLTANLKITTDQKAEVLTIPEYAIVVKNGKQYVERVLADGKKTEEVEVTIGLKGTNGMVEVISGLNEGDVVNLTLK